MENPLPSPPSVWRRGERTHLHPHAKCWMWTVENAGEKNGSGGQIDDEGVDEQKKKKKRLRLGEKQREATGTCGVMWKTLISVLTFSHLSTCCRAQGARKTNETVYLSVMIRAKHDEKARHGNMRIWTNVHVLLNLIYSLSNRYIF